MLTQPIRAVIVDDEPLARERIRLLLAQEADVTVAGEAGDGAEALRVIIEASAELVFLDVQMPEASGFDVLLCPDLPQAHAAP